MPDVNDAGDLGRRELLKILTSTTGYVALRVALPAVWSAPVVMAMALPAHAAVSCDNSGPPANHALDASMSLKATGSGDTVTVVVEPSAAMRTSHAQYTIVERYECVENPAAYRVSVIATVVPATGTGAFTQTLTRTTGKAYAYRLVSDTGYTDWVPVQL